MEPARREPPPDALPWSKGLAPRYIALFLLVVYYDQLSRRTLAVGGLLPSVAGLLIGAFLAVILFFRPLALSGVVGRIRLEEACARVFGRQAAWLLPGLLMGLAHIVWFAVAIDYAIDLAFRGLVSMRLLDPSHLGTQTLWGRRVPGALFLWVALAWSVTSALLGLVTYRLVAAVMAGYQPFVALALAAAAGWAFPLAGGFVPTGVDPGTGQTAAWPALAAGGRMIEMVLGFFATHAALGVDWGRSSRERADVEAGGWVGVAMAAVSTGCLALLIVAGANSRQGDPASRVEGIPKSPVAELDANGSAALTVRDALSSGLVPAPFSGIIPIVLSVGLLGPACFAPLLIARFLGLVAPGPPRWAWTVVGALAAWPLIALRLPERLDLAFTGLGVAIGPLVGVLAADWWRTRGNGEAGEGVRAAGVIAWIVGVAVGGALALASASAGPMVPTLAGYAGAWLVAYPCLKNAGPSEI